jgi:anti-anti-sigma regulatory factor
MSRWRLWYNGLLVRESVEPQHARMLQSLLLGIIGISLFGMFIPLAAPVPFAQGLILASIVALNALVAAVALLLLRRGHFYVAVLLSTIGQVFLPTFVLISTGLAQGGATLFTYALPIFLAGLLLGRQGVLLGLGLSIASIVLVIILERIGLPIIGFGAPRGDNTVGIVGGFIVAACIVGWCVDRFGFALRQALQQARARQHELEALSNALEATVAQRTAELQQALASAETRSAEQSLLVQEIERQRETIRELSVPVLPVGKQTVVMPLIGALDTSRLATAQEQALRAATRRNVRRLVLDITGVPLVDSQVALGLIQIVRAARLVGTDVVLVGMRPEVAQAVVGLGIDLLGIETRADVESALDNEFR